MMEFKASTIVRLARRRPEVLAELHHELLVRVLPLLSALGGRLNPYCGFRVHARTSRARWGESPHNYRPALAVDLVLDPMRVAVRAHPQDPRYPDLWDNVSPAGRAVWPDLEAEALRHGLERVDLPDPVTGEPTRDLPHLQLPSWRAFLPD
jgi:hypothetical protein